MFNVNVVTLTNAVIAVLPAGALFFWAYGRYDRTFHDQTVFFHFLGGLLMGGFLGALTGLALASRAPLFQVVGLAVIYPLALTAIVNRRKWQGNRHAVFNGGGLGIGVAIMMAFTVLLFERFRELLPATMGQAVMLTSSFAFLFFGLGLLVGDGVRRKRPFQASFLGAAIFIAPTIFIVEFFAGGFAWLWLILLLAYGVIFALVAERRLLIQGLTDEARRERRRRRRARA